MESIAIVAIGCIIVAIFDAIGSVLSRNLNFKYTWLAIGSVLIYGAAAIYSAKADGLLYGVIASGLLGVFDATAGNWISKKLKANTLYQKRIIYLWTGNL